VRELVTPRPWAAELGTARRWEAEPVTPQPEATRHLEAQHPGEAMNT